MRRTLVSGLILALLAVSSPAPAAPQPSGEGVRGQGCVTAGDDDTPRKTRDTALALARQRAIERHRVYVQSATTVKKFQVEHDLIDSASAAVLRDVRIEQETQRGREVCLTITATLSPVALEDLIRQKTKAQDVAQAARAPLLSVGSAFGLRVWTNQPDGQFLEGDRLHVSVQSDRDGYLKLDYFQADGTVVHLVPNLDRGDATITAGRTATFGGPGDRASFIIQGPFGAEAIKALVSTQPFDAALRAGRAVDESRTYLGRLQAATRDLNVTGRREINVTGRVAAWAEATVELMTTSRPARQQACLLAAVRGVRVQAGCEP